MNADLISAFVLLFLVLDPLGNLPVVASLLKQVDSTRRARVVARECFIAYLILLAFKKAVGVFGESLDHDPLATQSFRN
jgi:small neutral amino acid transporter SnatA (MarC family)